MKSRDCEVDRLRSLPDDLIHKILTYVDIIYAIRLSVLSSRWRFIPTSMPNLNFASDEVYSISSRYHEFVNDVLSARNNNIDDVSSVSLKLAVDEPKLCVKRILGYAFSHNVQQLSISIENYFVISASWLKSKSLKHLTMIETTLDCRYSSPWDLPALTTLHLHDVLLKDCSSNIAMCHNLKNLTLERCQVRDLDGFTIINSGLLSLTLKKVEWMTSVNVDTPQLKNFIFVDIPPQEYEEDFGPLSPELTIYAHDLTYLRIKGSYFPELSLDGVCSLETVDLCISSPQKTDVHKIHDMFQRFCSVKSLALSLEIVRLLYTSEEAISHQPSPFPSLKSLKIYPSNVLKQTLTSQDLETSPLKSSLDMFPTQLDQEQESMTIKLCAEVTNYLLDSCSNATFTMVSYEEARCIKITKVAYPLMAALGKILDEMEANYTETKRANVEWKKTLVDSCREDFKMRIGPRGDNEVIFCILQNLKILLTKVLASKRVEMQACFSRLCAITKTVVNMVAADIKNQCDIKQRNLCGYVDEIALSS